MNYCETKRVAARRFGTIDSSVKEKSDGTKSSRLRLQFKKRKIAKRVAEHFH